MKASPLGRRTRLAGTKGLRTTRWRAKAPTRCPACHVGAPVAEARELRVIVGDGVYPVEVPGRACPDCGTAEHVIRAHRASKLGHLVCDKENGHDGCGRRFWRASDAEIEAVKAGVMALDEDTLATVTVAMQAERVPTNMQAWSSDHAETARAILATEAQKRGTARPLSLEG